MRFKRRYFCVEIIFQDDLKSTNLYQMNKLKHTNLSLSIHDSIEKFYGDLGMAKMMPSFSVIYFNLNTQYSQFKSHLFSIVLFFYHPRMLIKFHLILDEMCSNLHLRYENFPIILF